MCKTRRALKNEIERLQILNHNLYESNLFLSETNPSASRIISRLQNMVLFAVYKHPDLKQEYLNSFEKGCIPTDDYVVKQFIENIETE